MVLQCRDDDFVSCADELAAITVHHQIDALGSAAHEDTFFDIARVDESLNLLARAFVGGRGSHAEIMNTPMNIRVFLFDVLRAALDHHHRHL